MSSFSVFIRESQLRHFLSSELTELTSAKYHQWKLKAEEEELSSKHWRGERRGEDMEEVNLAREAAGAVVCSPAVSYSESPLSNVLAGLDWMAETFMKPPVSLTVHLAVPVKLARLEWRTRVGRQLSLHHEVQVTTDLAALAPPGGCHCGQGQAGPFPLYKVGSGRATSDGRILFVNRRLSQSRQVGGFRLHCREDLTVLERVCAVTILISSTHNSSVPCLAQLNIVGQSTGLARHRLTEQTLLARLRSAPPARPANTFSFFGGDQSQVQSQVQAPDTDTASPLTDLTDTEETKEESEIPTEFLDSITHSLMRLPMTLPSGHHVDRETVEKCEDMFRTRGAVPRDPFTGRLFSQAHKPVFNADLKARIDRFLLTRRTLPTGGQTLGNAQSIEKFLSEKRDPARLGEKRKLTCDIPGQHLAPPPTVSSDKEECEDDLDDLDDDNNDLNEALKRTLAKRKKISKY